MHHYRITTVTCDYTLKAYWNTFSAQVIEELAERQGLNLYYQLQTAL